MDSLDNLMIRCALIKDVDAIERISGEVVISRHTPDSVSGFVEYKIPDIDNLRKRITSSPFFYVHEREGNVIGFLAAYRSSSLQSTIFFGDEIIAHVSSRQEPFVYFDQVAIAPSFQNLGLAIKLVEQLHLDAREYYYKLIRGPIAHAPHRNIASVKMAGRLGYLLEEELQTSNSLIFGIYSKSLL